MLRQYRMPGNERATAGYLEWRRKAILNRSESTESGCQLWTGATNHQGYGRIFYYRSYVPVHRVAFEAFTETAIPEGWRVQHKCKNRLCVNPDHLLLVEPKRT